MKRPMSARDITNAAARRGTYPQKPKEYINSLPYFAKNEDKVKWPNFQMVIGVCRLVSAKNYSAPSDEAQMSGRNNMILDIDQSLR